MLNSGLLTLRLVSREFVAMYIVVWISCLAWPVASAQDGSTGKHPEVGQRAIDFELPPVNEQGYLSLRDTYAQGPTVLIFLRGFPGHQCPYSSDQLDGLVNRAKALSQACHRIILVYPGIAEGLDRSAEEFLNSRRLPPPLVLVRDDDMKVVTQWGLRWDSARETTYPATFVLDKYGRIAWKKVGQNRSEHSSVEEILKALRKL
jgi:peroxiredoxin